MSIPGSLPIAVFAALLLVSGTAGDGGAATTTAPVPAATSAEALPSRAEIDAAMQRNFGYDASVTWKVLDIRPSGLAGLAEVVVQIGNQSPVHLFVAPGGQTALIGTLLPFGTDPYAAARAALKDVDGPALGSHAPAISIVVFNDLECPDCKTAEPNLEKLTRDFPQVRYVFAQFPFPEDRHPWAREAARFADCAGRANAARFWTFVDDVFAHQDAITRENVDERVKASASAAGYDLKALTACASLPATQARIDQSFALGTSLRVDSVPTAFINGRKVDSLGDVPYDQLKALVAFEITHAGH
jgi:protein-disulfide isomerase